MTARNREGMVVETEDYFRFARRIIAALGRRVGGDIETLSELRNLENEVRAATQAAVDACRDEGFSWDEIAQRLGVTRQSAWERYGRRTAPGAVRCQGNPDTQSPLASRAAC